MIFYFASIFESGQIVEQEKFESDTFDRNAVAHYLRLIDEGQDFGEDLEEVRIEFLTTGPKSAIVEVSSGKGNVTLHLLGSTDAASVMEELNTILATIQNAEQPVGEAVQIRTRPLVLALIPESTPDVLALARYPIALAAAFFETKST
jgi:hypothetical protein